MIKPQIFYFLNNPQKIRTKEIHSYYTFYQMILINYISKIKSTKKNIQKTITALKTYKLNF